MKLRRAKTLKQYKNILQLYKTAFPDYERKPLWMLFAKQNGQNGEMISIEENGIFIGLAISLRKENLVLLDYFAVRDDLRGSGYGARALKLLQRYYGEKKFFLEIEDVRELRGDPIQKQKRKAFYLRNGMTEQDVHVKLFGTGMELLGYKADVSFEEYQGLYRGIYGDQMIKRNVTLAE